jgi:hypothetical protein
MKESYTLENIRKHLAKIQKDITHIESEFYSQIYTVRTQGEARQLFGRLVKQITKKQGI